MSKIADEFHSLVAALEAEGHHLADKARVILAKLRGDEQQLATDAEADVQQVEADARPVMQEAQADVTNLAREAEADLKDITNPQPPAAA